MAFSSSIGGIVVVYVGGNTSKSENSATIAYLGDCSINNNCEAPIKTTNDRRSRTKAPRAVDK